MNRRGEADLTGDWLLMSLFFFYVAIMGVGIVVGFWIFFGDGIDIRQTEADLLNYRIRDCIGEEEIELLDEREFYSKCRLSKVGVTEGKLIFKICQGVGEEKCLVSEDYLFLEGSNFQTCRLKGGEENEAFPKCVIRSVSRDKIDFVVITGSNQKARREVG